MEMHHVPRIFIEFVQFSNCSVGRFAYLYNIMYLKTFNSLRFKMFTSILPVNMKRVDGYVSVAKSIHVAIQISSHAHTCNRTRTHTKSTTTLLCMNASRGVFCALWPPTSHQIRTLAGYFDYVRVGGIFFVVTRINCITLVEIVIFWIFSSTTTTNNNIIAMNTPRKIHDFLPIGEHILINGSNK